MKVGIRRVFVAIAVGVGVMAAIGVWLWPKPQELSVDYKMPGNPQPKIDAAKAAAIERRERVIDQTIWKKEIEAQEYGRVFEDFWDALNAATNKWAVVEAFRFAEIGMGQGRVKESLPHGIERWAARTAAVGKKSESPHVDSYDFGKWLEEVTKWKAAGWDIMQCEFRHNAFDPQTNQIPAKSKFYFAVHLTNAAPSRAVVEGDLFVEWKLRKPNEPALPQRIDASRLQVLLRAGPPAFEPVLSDTIEPPDLTKTIEPLLVYDLDGDGIVEIVLPSANRVYRKRGERFEAEKFCSTARLPVLNGVFADMDGDGEADLLYAEYAGISLLKGAKGGRFEFEPRAVAPSQNKLAGRPAITCGDIDADGDLDVFIGQYKAPFIEGSMPTPYYDANDGYPSYLYLNDGRGNLRDVTFEAGLAGKRLRRVYGASFVDLNTDGALDLVVTSDFAGVDVYQNDGHGKFTDVTKSSLDQPHAFGMGHAFGDFNNDGRLDLYVTGMQSPTAERLERIGVNRPSSRMDATMRGRMISGSRLYSQLEGGRFAAGAAADSVARSGWSWGASAADFDNDGWLDLYVVNGMESMGKVGDYDRDFWLHDIFVGDSGDNQFAGVYFQKKQMNRLNASESYGGYEKNRLYLNHGGTNFNEVAHLLGVALEYDGRNLVATDFDGDGRVDLAFTTEHGLPSHKQKLHVFRNAIKDKGNWVAFSFREEPGRRSPIGAQVLLRGAGLKKVAALVTGDSFRSQHPTRLHFGLADVGSIETAEIRWPGGAVTRLAGPEINQTHAVRALER
jgi:enediyne biosynthesis protein E4